MDLRDALKFIATNYDRTHADGNKQPAQLLLSNASKELGHYAPLGFKVGGSGQNNFRLPFSPWIGFLNTDESTRFTEGLYVVYLFSEDLKYVFLSLNQGTENLKKVRGLKTSEQLQYLSSNALAIRKGLKNAESLVLDSTIDLGISAGRPRTYEAGNIVSVRYQTDALPSSLDLAKDLNAFFELYEHAISVRNRLLLSNKDDFLGFNPNPAEREAAALTDFRPKDDSSYEAEIKARKVTKSRRHESLVNRFGERAQISGFTASTPHPIDVLLQNETQTWVVEAKIVYEQNFAGAVRGAIGQLLEYRFFLQENAGLIALFDRPIPGAYLKLLAHLDINVFWLEQSGFQFQAVDGHADLLQRLCGQKTE